MVYHTCNLDDYPVRYGDVVFKVKAVAVRLLLFENDRKILDYREAMVADMLDRTPGLINITSYFETPEVINDRAVVNVRDKVQKALTP